MANLCNNLDALYVRNVLCFIVISFAGGYASSAQYEFRDRKVDNDYLGATTWKTNNGVNVVFPPQSGDTVYVTSGTGYDTVVSVTNDVSVDYKRLVFKAQPSSSFKFYTSGDASTFEMPYSEGGAYNSGSSWALGFQHGDGNIFAALYPSTANGPCFSWEEPEFTLTSDASGLSTLEVLRGTFDFRSVGGYSATANTFKMTTRGGTVLFGTNVTVKLPNVEIDHANANLLFRGANLTECGAFTEKQKYVEFSDGASAVISALDINSSTKPQMVVSNATVTVTGNAFIGSSTDGKLIVYDGGAVSVKSGNAIQVAHGGGSGGIEVHGGSLKTERIRVSRGSATSAKSAYILQTGGTITLSGSGIQFQQSCTADNVGTHYVQLDGGVLKAKSIFRDATVTAGTVYLSGNGGTYQAYDAGTLANRLAYAECGEKGLTVDTAGYNCTFAVPVKDKSDSNGQFVKKGAGTLTMSLPSDYTVSRTVAAGGTLKFSGDFDAHTDLVVTNGAAFSLAGTAASAAIDSLVVTNGVFELDPGDVVTVNGAFSVKGLRIRWTSLPATEQTVLVCQGALSDDMKRELRKTRYDNAVPAGEHASITFEYDDETHSTSIRASVAADVPLTGEATWTGNGAWAMPANWEASVKPDATKIAVFGAGASGQSVAVSNGDIAGALSFTGGAYSLSGADALRIDGDPGAARIDVAAGSHVVSAPLDVLFSLPVEVASGAQLSLDGVVNAASLAKTGLGRLVLGGTLDTLQGFSTAEGFSTVTNAAALGATAASPVKISAGTLEFCHPAGEEMTIAAPVVMYATNNKERVVFKTDTDVTFTDFDGTSGNFYKRGAGTLTFDVPASTTYRLTYSTGGSPETSTIKPVEFPADGSAPTGGFAACCLVEGGVKVVGHESSRMECIGGIILGAPTTSSSAQASLTIDKTFFVSWGEFYPGHTATVNNHNTHPVLRVLNGGTFHANSGVMPGYSCTSDKVSMTFALTNGTYRLAAADTYLTRGRIDASDSTYIVVRYLMNDSRLYVNNSVLVGGSILIDADNGSFVGGYGNVPMTLKWAEVNRTYGEIRARNGSTLALGAINEASSQNRDITFAFNDAEWLYDSEHGDKTWPASTTGHTLYEMRGKGVILKPALGHTFTTLAPFRGTGGLIVDGEGTVAFGADTAQFTGTLDVRQGAADFSSNGGAAAFKSAKGAGTVSGATMGSLTLPIELLPNGTSSNSLMFANCTFGGGVKVDLGRTAETALARPYPENVLVARYTGTAPAVGSWRLVGTGVKGVRGKFTAANGEVRMNVESAGVVLIIK